DDTGVVGRGRAPGLAAVGRGAHLQEIAGAVIVPLGVAVAVERAGHGVVADDPVLVQVAAGGGLERVAPGETPVGGAAGDHCAGVHAAGLQQGQRGDQPDVVHGVVGARRVADPVGRATTDVLGDAGQQAVRPRAAVVGRGGEADHARAAVEDP